MSTYIQHLSIVCVMLDGAEFTVDADLRGSTAIVHGIKLAGKWWHADRVLSCDFTEELEAAIVYNRANGITGGTEGGAQKAEGSER